MKKSGDRVEKEIRMCELRVLVDIRMLLKNYYLATVCFNGDKLEIKFNNGQTFTVSVEEKR